MAQSGSLGAAGKIIKVLREKGKMSPKDLIAEVGVPRRTFYRALNLLKEVDVVVKEDGDYCWYEYSGARVFFSDFEAQQMIEHSRKIANALGQIFSGRSYNVEKKANNKMYLSCGLIHLRTGYPGISKNYTKLNEIRECIDDSERELRNRMSSRLPTCVDGDFAGYLVDRIFDDLRRSLEGREPRLLSRIVVDDGVCRLDGYVFDEENYGVVRRFIDSELSDGCNVDRCRVLLGLLEEYRECRVGLEDDLELLLSRVENGTPLAGSCSLCPKMRIEG